MKAGTVIKAVLIRLAYIGGGFGLCDVIQKKRVKELGDKLAEQNKLVDILNQTISEIESQLKELKAKLEPKIFYRVDKGAWADNYEEHMASYVEAARRYAEDAEADEEAAPDDDPPMVEETPVIGDEEAVEKSPAIEFITEEEFYDNSSGFPQEELIWYMLDEVLFNRDTKSRMTVSEIEKSIGYSTLDIFDEEGSEDSIFVRNNILPAMFRVDRIEGAWCDEHGDTYEEDD